MCCNHIIESPVKPKKAAAVVKKETPTRTTPSRRAKKNVVVLDDSDDDLGEISSKKTNDEDFELDGDEEAKPVQRKRLRRALDNGDGGEVGKPRATSVKKEDQAVVEKSHSTKTAPAAAAKAAAVKVEVKAESEDIKVRDRRMDSVYARKGAHLFYC